MKRERFRFQRDDADGRPVAAEVALGLIDESVSYIQRDYAGDPRQFYYGTKRARMVQTQSSFNQKAYVKLVEGANKRLIDERVLTQQRKDAGEDDAPYSKLESLADLEMRPSGTLQGARRVRSGECVC